MKNIALSISTIAIICLVGWIIFVQECKRSPEGEIPDGYALISQEALDSINEIANQPPDTVKVDTIIKEIVYRFPDLPVPDPVPADSGVNLYIDTVENATIKMWYRILTLGELKEISLGGEIKSTTIDRTIEKPRPVIISNPIKEPFIERGLFLGLQTGGSPAGGLMFGVELTYHNRKHNYYCLGASRFGEYNIYEFKFGTRILHW